jgi:HSP20 family protein
MSAMIRWNPVYRMRPQQRAFMNSMGRLASNWDSRVAMPLDIEENEDGYVVTASVPGFTSENLTIEVEDDVLTIRAEQEGDEEQERGEWRLRERYMGAIERKLRLGKSVNTEAIEAELEHGVLKLTLPKAEQAKPQLIKVKVAG